jgi:hypothetical protein
MALYKQVSDVRTENLFDFPDRQKEPRFDLL